MAQRQDLHVLVSIAHRQQTQHGERVRHTQVGQSQQHGRPSCRSDRQPRESPSESNPGRHPGRPRAPAPTRADEIFGRGNAKKLTALETKTGWRYQVVATSITRLHALPGSHQPQWLDALHRAHAGVEDQVRHGKAMGLRNLPSNSWTVNQGWVLTCNIAADLTAWTRLLGLHDQPDLAHAEPETLRYRLLHLPAKLATHARRRRLSIPDNWPWADAFTLCWQRLNTLPPAT
ncbi:transposase [Micromonospora sp. NBC_01638]|uniref:transposase n=1 Tax=Micromonospora sp. NBC_01638 TaxID=2975982 RepID=UPI00386FF971|nr:transposase [Micromonospora sp. NBC_01638]